jgi:F-type H+-transporting ATPase subunit epsilon
MAHTLRLVIVTPDARTYDDVDMVVLPGSEGELGVLPGHEPLFSGLLPGDAMFTKDGRNTAVVLGGGYAQVLAHQVIVLADSAVRSDQAEAGAFDAARRQAAQKREEMFSTQTR